MIFVSKDMKFTTTGQIYHLVGGKMGEAAPVDAASMGLGIGDWGLGEEGPEEGSEFVVGHGANADGGFGALA